MRIVRVVVIGTACSAALMVGYVMLREPALVPPPPPVEVTGLRPAVAPGAFRAAPQVPAAAPVPSPVPAGIAHAFAGGTLPQSVLQRLVAGDVASVAAELAAGTDAASAVNLFDLAALCEREGKGPPEAALADERGALEPSGLAAATRATVVALIAARHAWTERFRLGCAATAFDAASIRSRLAAAGASGDAASLERLATTEARPELRLSAAALLGNPRAAFKMALANSNPAQRDSARSWLEIAAKGDPDAEAFLGTCLLAGCGGPADPASARLALESAARAGSLYALGLLASADGGTRRWVRGDALVAPVAPADLGALDIDSAGGYAWAALAATLAANGCFGFEFTPAAEALETRAMIETRLRAGDLTAARARATELAATTLAATRHALGCD